MLEQESNVDRALRFMTYLAFSLLGLCIAIVLNMFAVSIVEKMLTSWATACMSFLTYHIVSKVSQAACSRSDPSSNSG